MGDLDDELATKPFDREGPPPSPREAAIGIYLPQRDELKVGHPTAFSETVRQLMELYPDASPLQANLVTIKAVKACPMVDPDPIDTDSAESCR